MIDLRNKCVLVRTQEEYEKILEEAKKQGFRWQNEETLEKSEECRVPFLLSFYSNYTAAYERYKNIEASEILGTKEMTAREFIEYTNKIRCSGNVCDVCVLNGKNTKCKKMLCLSWNWAGNENELISIAKSGRVTIKPQKETILESFRDFLDSPTDNPTITSDFIESLQIVVNKLKEQGV